jgi:hypothetical protein
MCIMEVRPGQKSSTIAMAMAHNTSTVMQDLDFFRKLLAARQEFELLRAVDQAQGELRKAYANFLEVYGEEVTSEVQDAAGHVHDEPVGSERTLVGQAHHDAGLARRYETR